MTTSPQASPDIVSGPIQLGNPSQCIYPRSYLDRQAKIVMQDVRASKRYDKPRYVGWTVQPTDYGICLVVYFRVASGHVFNWNCAM